jgi:predicted DNA-binding antitoxin AbrB/MazE fold protein
MAVTTPRQQTIDAVYERGTLRILQPEKVDLEEGQQVRIIVEATQSSDEEDLLEAMFHFFDDLPKEEVQEIQKIILDRHGFFGDRAAV